MKYSIILLIVVSNYCMGMDIALLLNPKENTLNAVSDWWSAEPTCVQNSNSDQDTESNNTTGIECPICHLMLYSKKQLQVLRQHMFSQHIYSTLDPELKDKIENCKIETAENGKSNFVRCITEDCPAQLKINKGSQRRFVLKQHLAHCHFDKPLDSAIKKNPNTAKLIKKRTRTSSHMSHCLPCPVEKCSLIIRNNNKPKLQPNLIAHLFNKHLLLQDENLRKEIEQNRKNQKSKPAISCWYSGCEQKYDNVNVKNAFGSMLYHYAIQHCAERVKPFCGDQSIEKYIDGQTGVGTKKQK